MNSIIVSGQMVDLLLSVFGAFFHSLQGQASARVLWGLCYLSWCPGECGGICVALLCLNQAVKQDGDNLQWADQTCRSMLGRERALYSPIRLFVPAVWHAHPKFQKRKISPKRKFSAGRPCGHPAKDFGQALQVLDKTSILARTCRADVHEKNFGLKNFGLIFHSLKLDS